MRTAASKGGRLGQRAGWAQSQRTASPSVDQRVIHLPAPSRVTAVNHLDAAGSGPAPGPAAAQISHPDGSDRRESSASGRQRRPGHHSATLAAHKTISPHQVTDPDHGNAGLSQIPVVRAWGLAVRTPSFMGVVGAESPPRMRSRSSAQRMAWSAGGWLCRGKYPRQAVAAVIRIPLIACRVIGVSEYRGRVS
jgi:hypothetical protein